MPAAGTKPDSIPTTDVDTTPQRQRRARLGRRVFMSLMALFVLAGLGTLVGAHTSRISATGSGYSMTLTYSSITRPGLAIRWILVIEHPGGFDKQITVATTSTYFNLFDFNNLDPVPADQTTHGPYSIWIYDPPPGNSLRIIFDGRLEPDQQFGKAATTELRVDGATVASLHYSTRVIPQMEIVVRAMVMFAFLLVVTRAMGKKELSQLSAFELILLITMGDLIQQGVTQEDQSIVGAMLAVSVLAVLIVALSFAEFRWNRTRPLIRGVPVVVLRDGRPLDEPMRIERLKLAELKKGAREQGIDDLAKVKVAILEPDGKLSFIKAEGEEDGDGRGAPDSSVVT